MANLERKLRKTYLTLDVIRGKMYFLVLNVSVPNPYYMFNAFPSLSGLLKLWKWLIDPTQMSSKK